MANGEGDGTTRGRMALNGNLGNFVMSVLGTTGAFIALWSFLMKGTQEEIDEL